MWTWGSLRKLTSANTKESRSENYCMFSWPVFVFFPRAHRHTHHHMPFFREHSQSSDRLNMARILTQHTSFLFWSRLRTQSGGPPLGYHRDIVGVRHKLVRWCVYLFLWDSWTRFYCVISCNAFWGSQVVSCVWVPRCRRPTNPAGWTWCSPSDTHTHMSHDTHVWGHTLTVYTNEPLNDTMTAKIYRGLQNDVTWSYFNGTKKNAVSAVSVVWCLMSNCMADHGTVMKKHLRSGGSLFYLLSTSGQNLDGNCWCETRTTTAGEKVKPKSLPYVKI